MHLSRPRVLIRAALLWVGGAFMLVKAIAAHRAARLAEPADAVLLGRIALVEALMGVLALAAGAVALLALRRRPRSHTLHLEDVDRPSPPGPAGDGRGAPPGPAQ
ncbi:MAG TPA: hypothetical protein VFM45_08650 [Anaeromyxobacteraceae bacterium]|nr:hypothetical protein [Anaeromyxobacteraceae bacterium]